MLRSRPAQLGGGGNTASQHALLQPSPRGGAMLHPSMHRSSQPLVVGGNASSRRAPAPPHRLTCSRLAGFPKPPFPALPRRRCDGQSNSPIPGRPFQKATANQNTSVAPCQRIHQSVAMDPPTARRGGLLLPWRRILQ